MSSRLTRQTASPSRVLSLLTAAILLLLTVWFAVGAGFFAGFISGAALFVVGFFALRSKPAH